MRVAVLDDYQHKAAQLADWDSLSAEIDFFHAPISDLVMTLAAYDVLVLMRERTKFSAETLAALPNLKLVVTTGMRNASLDVGHLHDRGVPVSGTGIPNYGAGQGVASTVEIAWGLIFATRKRVVAEDRLLRQGVWQAEMPVNLAHSTLGLVGLGRLGSQMVAPAKAFGMEVLAWSQNLGAERAGELGAQRVGFGELLAYSDVVSIHLVLSERTRGLFGAAQLEAMKPGASLINTSRGPIVEEAALLDALRRGRISAGLDVFDQEPLPPGHSLTALDNAVLTPHLGYVSEEALAGMYAEAVEDIAAFQAGTPIRLVS
ncbi:MAG: D-2-hydroxyacid dehydrogenase family protein [Solirubrobacterales bacterium]|nr:D-2-hydroxyacid dehydrogenase family protein [Solirubrobacterales bacterium]